MLALINARWVRVQQTSSSNIQRNQTTGQQMVIDGHVYAIGSDWVGMHTLIHVVVYDFFFADCHPQGVPGSSHHCLHCRAPEP